MHAKLLTYTALSGACVLSAAADVYAGQDIHSGVSGMDSTQEENTEFVLEEIIVTANKREESVQDVAASISVKSGAELVRSGINNSTEIAHIVPNVTITSTFNNSNPRIYIRGVGSSDFNPNAASPVGIYVDDVYLASTNALQFQLYDIQRVEVLRGPQGTLYGRNTTAGAIKYVSNLPNSEFEAGGRLRAGNYDYYGGEGFISGSLIDDKLNARIAFIGEDADGTVRNELTGDYTGNDIRSWGARAMFNFLPAEDWDLLLNVHGGRASPHNVVYKPRGTLTATGEACDAQNALAFNCYDVLGYRDHDNLFAVSNNVVGREIVETLGASLHIEKSFDWATFTSITAAHEVDLTREEDSDGSPNQLLEIQYASNSEQFSQEFRLVSPGDERINWIAGVYYSKDELEFNNQYDVLRSLRPFVGFDPGSFVILADQLFTQEDKSYAIFGRVDFALANDLKLTLGLRYTDEERSFEEVVSLVEPDFTIPVFTTGDTLSNDKVSGDVILDYQLKDDVMLYASIAQGFKSGGFNGGIVFDPEEVTTYGPETITSYEIGVKSRLYDDRLTLNAAAFYYDYDDLQVYTILNPEGGGVPIQVLENAATAEVYGLEADASLYLSNSLQLTASLGFLETEFKDYQSDVAESDYTGNELSRAPGMTASIGIDYQHQVGSGYRMFVNLLTSYRDNFFFDASNNARLAQDGYWLANARLGLAPEQDNWSVSIWMKNMFDEEYFRDVIDLSIFGYDGITIGSPRAYGIEFAFGY